VGIDFDGDCDVDFSDYTDFVSNFTGAFRDGQGQSRPEDGDIDQDGDVDYIDQVLFVEAWEPEPTSCSTYSTILEYDPATGASTLSVVSQGNCMLGAFALESDLDILRPENFPKTGISLKAIERETRDYQIGAFNILINHDPFDSYEVGRILPPLLTQDTFESAITIAWAVASHGDPPVSIDLVALPMPALGDTDRDSDVDTVDQLTLMEHWTGAQEPGTAGKIFDQGVFDFDEDVDTNDMLILIEGWTGAASERFVGPVMPVRTNSVRSVPEPASQMVWLVTSLTAIGACRRRRNVSRSSRSCLKVSNRNRPRIVRRLRRRGVLI
jgi:hypothetical protein